MQRRAILSWVEAALVAGAFGTSLFFVGFNIEVLCVVLLLLLARLAIALSRAFAAGLHVPRSPLALGLVAYPLWLAATVLWSPVPSISIPTLWWALVWPLVYWSFVLEPAGARAWRPAWMLVLGGGIVLALAGLYQAFVLAEAPEGPFLDRNIYAMLLVVIALPLAGYFLSTEINQRHRAALGVAFFLLVFVAALTQSRSATLTFVVGAVVLVTIAWHRTRAISLGVLGALSLMAFIAANFVSDGGLVDRLATLEQPHESGHTRYLIWQSTWRMIWDHPWTGVGLGMYPLRWPPYRNPEDTSGGYFAHNDYLQAWADAGLPALLLLLGILAAAAWVIARVWRRSAVHDPTRAELGGLAAAVVALPFNSFFNYNFYIVPSLIVFGMCLARLQMLDAGNGRVFVLPIDRAVRKPVWHTLVVLLALAPLFYFVSVGGAAWLTERAIREARAGEYELADATFLMARRLWPSADSIEMLHADLYRHLLAASAAPDPDKRAEVFRAADAMLRHAEQLNPFRADVFVIRAELWRANPVQAPQDWRASIERDYRRALGLDPWHYRARQRLASFLLEQGKAMAARAVLEEVAAGPFHAWRDDVLPYLALAAKLREQAGDGRGAAALRQQARDIAAARKLERQRREGRYRLMPHRLLLAS